MMKNLFESFCKRCRKNAHCCIFKGKSEFAFVSAKDAKKIKRAIKKEYDYFLDYSPFPKKIINELKNEDPTLEGALRLSQLKDNRILRLKSKKDRRCIFLNDYEKCDIYQIRPNICRIYPFWAIKLNNKKIKIIPHNTPSECNFIKSLGEDIEKNLPQKEIRAIKAIFRDIQKER